MGLWKKAICWKWIPFNISMECDNALMVVVKSMVAVLPLSIYWKIGNISPFQCRFVLDAGEWNRIEIYRKPIDSLVRPMHFVIRTRAWYIVISQESLFNRKKIENGFIWLPADKLELVNVFCKLNEWLTVSIMS